MFEVLHSAMQKGRVEFIDDAFFTFTDKGDYVTSTAFFSLNEAATLNLMAHLELIADGRRVMISLHETAPEIAVLASRGYAKTGAKGALQYWEKADASGNA